MVSLFVPAILFPSELPVSNSSKFLAKQYLHSKNVSPLTIHDPTVIIIGRNVTEKVRNQTMLCFHTSPI